MAGVTHIQIQESAEELEKLLRQQKNPRLKERVQVLYLIQVKGFSIGESAKVSGRHRATIQRWLADYRRGGMTAMLEFKTSPGRKQVIPDWAVKSLQKQLEQEEGGWQRYTQVQFWLDSVLGVKAAYATVHHLTRYKLKAKLKVPRPRNRKQNQQQLQAFKKTLETTYP